MAEAYLSIGNAVLINDIVATYNVFSCSSNNHFHLNSGSEHLFFTCFEERKGEERFDRLSAQ